MHRGETQRSRTRRKPRRGYDPRPAPPCDSVSAGWNFAEGKFRSKEWIKVARTEHESNCEHGSPHAANGITIRIEGCASKSKKGSGMPMKALIDEEMSKEKHSRRSPPSLIARLMGLDTLPSPGTYKPVKESWGSSSKASIKDFREKISTHEDCLVQNNSMVQQEYKDVFEVVQSPKFEKEKEILVKSRGERFKRHETDKAFACQCVIEPSNLSTQDVFHQYKQFSDAIKVLEPYKDIYLPNIHNSPPSFSKNLKEHSHSPFFSNASCPIPRASKGSLNTSCESSFRLERNANGNINPKRGELQAVDKLEIDHSSHSSREHLFSLLHKLSDSSYSGKVDCRGLPTKIVILKPSLVDRKVERTIPPKSSAHLQYSPLSYRQYPIVETDGLNLEERSQKKMDNTRETMGQNLRGSRGVAKRVTKQMRGGLASERNKNLVSKLGDYVDNEGSNMVTSISWTSQWTSSNLNEYSNSSSSTSLFQTESPIKREAKQRLSQRWKLTSRFQELELSSKGSNTLGEMLALSDNDMARVTSDASLHKTATERKLGIDDLYEQGKRPLGISSKDGWKDGFSSHLRRSKSLPGSALLNEISQHNSANQLGNGVVRVTSKNIQEIKHYTTLHVDVEEPSLGSLINDYNDDKYSAVESTLTELDTRVSPEEQNFDIDVASFSEEQCTALELSDASIAQGSTEVGIIPVPESSIDNTSLTTNKMGFECLKLHTKSDETEKLLEFDKLELLSNEGSVNHDGNETFRGHKSPSLCPESYKDSEQPSPVSVLEVPFVEDKFTSECFENISANLRELRMQIRLLKQESADCHAEDVEALDSSGTDTAEPFPELGDVVQAFRDEEDRDYSYVLDILIHSGVLNSPLEGFFTSFHSADYPVAQHVFNKLEKKYISIESWPRADRKVLFDLTNAILADIIMLKLMKSSSWLKPKMHWQSDMVLDDLVEEVWQAVVKEMKDMGGRFQEGLTGLPWVGSEEEKELIGRELENAIHEDFINELVVDLACRYMV
ncbi:hypothetical protein HPP92_006594 [Vanilla planifolia]|uniref:DUF4378 domain-containing protein n=1 Tax=Vanilla planifolia TaxID=51239 RepID=A0A835RCB8_VANPL|nr:hypothetical protein HPP92_006594 [Vanilla planifolia]